MLGKKAVNWALVLIIGAMICGATSLTCGADRVEVFTGLVVQPMISARPVAGPDGRVHLAYELSFVNETKVISQVDSIAAVDADSGAVLTEWKGKELSEIFRINAGESGTALGPSHSAYAFLDVTLAASAPAPKNIKHRISVSRSMPDASNEHKSTGGELQAGMPSNVTFEGAPTPVDTKRPIVVAPPLRGPGWVAINGCCAQISAHRGSVLALLRDRLDPGGYGGPAFQRRDGSAIELSVLRSARICRGQRDSGGGDRWDAGTSSGSTPGCHRGNSRRESHRGRYGRW